MGMEYYATFAPVPLTREALIFPLNKLLSEMNARLDQECDRLDWGDGQFEYSEEPEICGSLQDAVRTSSHWGGVEVYFGWGGRNCSLLLWNDVPGHTTVTLCESGVLFERQVEDAESRASWVTVLLRFMETLGAGFCVFEPGSEFRSLSREAVFEWLGDVENGKPRDWVLVAASEQTIPAVEVKEAVRRKLLFKLLAEQKLWILSSIGDFELEEPRKEAK